MDQRGQPSRPLLTTSPSVSSGSYYGVDSKIVPDIRDRVRMDADDTDHEGVQIQSVEGSTPSVNEDN